MVPINSIINNGDNYIGITFNYIPGGECVHTGKVPLDIDERVIGDFIQTAGLDLRIFLYSIDSANVNRFGVFHPRNQRYFLGHRLNISIFIHLEYIEPGKPPIVVVNKALEGADAGYYSIFQQNTVK